MEIIVLLIIAGCVYWLYRNRAGISKPEPQWARNFAIFHVTRTMSLYGSFDPMPKEAVSLLEPRLTGAAQQSLIVGLSNYLRAHHGRNIERGDYEPAVKSVRDLLSAEVRRANSAEGVRSYIKAVHREETGKEITESELSAGLAQLLQEAKLDDMIAARVLGDTLRFNMNVMFRGAFGVDYWDYVKANTSSSN